MTIIKNSGSPCVLMLTISFMLSPHSIVSIELTLVLFNDNLSQLFQDWRERFFTQAQHTTRIGSRASHQRDNEGRTIHDYHLKVLVLTYDNLTFSIS